MKLRLELEYEVNSASLEEALIELETNFAIENTTAENEFWGNMELVNDEVETEIDSMTGNSKCDEEIRDTLDDAEAKLL